MKKNYKFVLSSLFLLILLTTFTFSNHAEAIPVPFTDLKVIVNTVGEDGEFNYDFNGSLFKVTTVNGVGSSTISIDIRVGVSRYLTQATSSGWNLLDISCTSTNPDIVVDLPNNRVIIGPYPYNPITCIFTNTKVINKNPVIIIPGILSSYLKENTSNVEVWPNLVKAFETRDDSYLDTLALDMMGQPDFSHPIMIPTDLLRKISVLGFPIKDFFGGLIEQLENDGYTENSNLFVFPYDWRLNIVDSVSNVYSPLLTSLKDKVDQVLAQTGAQKVDIVAHSMGGLLAKYYIEHYGQGKVDKFVDIATPHFGAPDAFKNLMYGGDIGIKFGPFGLNPLEIKKISQNLPAVYQLLPSAKYFSSSLPDYNYYIYDMDDYDGDGVKGRLSFEQSLDFLKNTGRNDLVMNNAINIHVDLDNMNPADYGVKTYNIVGCGTPTIGKIFTLGKENDPDPHYDLAYISGDGTVPQRSAEGIPSQEQFYVSKVQHGIMPSASGVKELVSSLLAGTEVNFNYASSTNISTTNANCKLPNGTQIEFHSPVELHIYDSVGNHTGPNENGDLEENIPGIAYDIIDGNKFAYLPNGENYQIELKATDSGSFSSHIKKIEEGTVVSTAYFSNVPLQSPDTTAKVDITTPIPTLALDQTGTGQSIQTYSPSAVIAGDSLEDTVAPEFVFSVAPNIFELNISAAADISATTVTSKDISKKPSHLFKFNKNKSKMFAYSVSDEAGNSTNMTVEINKETESKLNYDINFPDIKGNKPADAKNSGVAKEISMIFTRELDKKGNLKTFTQTIKQGKDVIRYVYNVKKDKTLIRERDGKQIDKIVYNEEKSIEFISNNGVIEIKN